MNSNLPRIIMSLSRDFIFHTAFYEEELPYEDYYEKEDALKINDLPLSIELKSKLIIWHDIFIENLQDDFTIKSDIIRMVIEIKGDFLYDQVIKELKDKYYVVYSPYSSLFNEENYPVIINSNK